MLVETYYINADLHSLSKKKKKHYKLINVDHLTTIRRSMEGYHARLQLIRSNGLKRGFRYESVDHADRQMRLRNLEKIYKKDNLRLTELVKDLSQQKDALCLH